MFSIIFAVVQDILIALIRSMEQTVRHGFPHDMELFKKVGNMTVMTMVLKLLKGDGNHLRSG